ncbi:MAG: hypothetical protein ACUVXB_02230 [Bryobacteraceae bacterium]
MGKGQGSRVLIAAAAWWVLTQAAAAQTSAQRGKLVVEEAIAALGGDRFLSMKDRVETGRAYSFYREEVSGLAMASIYTKYVPVQDSSSPATLAVRERQSFLRNKKEFSAVLFTDTAGYTITFRGARPLPDDSLERYRLTTFTNIFYILRVRRNEPGLLFELKGTDVWLNQPVNIVDITDSENRVVTVYFHQSEKFPLRQVFYRRDAKTRQRIEEVTEYGKYRENGNGVWWPWTIQRMRDGQKIFEMYSESVTVDSGVSDSLFVLPSDIKILKKL